MTVGNTPPTISISSPANGSTFKTADQIQFTGVASDFDQGSLTGSIAWTSSRDGAIGSGGTFTRRLSKGTHTITASITDANGSTRTAVASITVTNTPPVVSISGPANGASYKTADLIQFNGTASDFEQGSLSSSIAWSSNRDGALGSGATLSRRLTKGTHTITASIIDADGATTAATVTITVANTPPTVSLTSPANGASFKTIDDISLQATASDFDQGSLTGSISWSSSSDGALGSGGTVTRKLSKGTHTITASVTDADGGSAGATTTITVANTPPSISISGPAGGSNFSTDDSIQFAGAASDFDQGNLSSSMAWTSSLDGAIGTGGSFTKKLTAGSHVITASVTDAHGASAAATVTVNVVSATILKVHSISYATSGPGHKHVDVTVRVVNWSNAPVAGASVSFDLYLGNAIDRSASGLTDATGTFTYQRSAAPSGCYRSVVTSAAATGLQWDGTTPTNNFCKPG